VTAFEKDTHNVRKLKERRKVKKRRGESEGKDGRKEGRKEGRTAKEGSTFLFLLCLFFFCHCECFIGVCCVAPFFVPRYPSADTPEDLCERSDPWPHRFSHLFLSPRFLSFLPSFPSRPFLPSPFLLFPSLALPKCVLNVHPSLCISSPPSPFLPLPVCGNFSPTCFSRFNQVFLPYCLPAFTLLPSFTSFLPSL
jgi:hypothetical protein